MAVSYRPIIIDPSTGEYRRMKGLNVGLKIGEALILNWDTDPNLYPGQDDPVGSIRLHVAAGKGDLYFKERAGGQSWDRVPLTRHYKKTFMFMGT